MNVKHEKSVFKKSLLVIAISSSLCSYASAQEQASEKEIEVITVTRRAAQFYFIDESTMVIF